MLPLGMAGVFILLCLESWLAKLQLNNKKTVFSDVALLSLYYQRRQLSRGCVENEDPKTKTEDLRPCGLKRRPRSLKRRPSTSLKRKSCGSLNWENFSLDWEWIFPELQLKTTSIEKLWLEAWENVILQNKNFLCFTLFWLIFIVSNNYLTSLILFLLDRAKWSKLFYNKRLPFGAIVVYDSVPRDF